VVGKSPQVFPRFTSVSHRRLRVDVGGGAVENETPNSLARIPLRWMVRQCFLAETGIMFNSKLLARIGLDPGTLYPRVLPRPDPITSRRADRPRTASDDSSGMSKVANNDLTLTEEEEDLEDMLSPINDGLSLSKSWWLLELMPIQRRHQKRNGTWVWRTKPNMGHGRYIPRGDNHKIRVHRTVKLRMDAKKTELPEGRRYVPRAKPWEHDRVEWVD